MKELYERSFMRAAFSLMELVLVLAVVAIVAGVGSSVYHSNRALIDARYIALQIDKTRYQAIGYDHRIFGGGFDSTQSIGCIDLAKKSFESNATSGEEGGIHPETQISIISGIDGTRLCFDATGAPHTNDFSMTHLLRMKVELNVSNGKEHSQVIVMPTTGYVIINQ
jgi:prepilin-type N-terminal cleavage/methylation domain-containing protein